MDVAEGKFPHEALFGVLKDLFPYGSAVLLANAEGVLKAIASDPSTEIAPINSKRSLVDLLQVSLLRAGESKDAIGNVAELAENALTMPVGIGGRAGVLVLCLPAHAVTPGHLSIARACSVVSMASLLAGGSAQESPAAKANDQAAPEPRLPAAQPALQDMHLLKVILDHLPISLTVQDSEGRFVLANAMAAADLAVSVEKLLGSSPADFLSEQEAISRRNWERSVATGGKTIMAETRVPDLEGERILLTSHTPVNITNNQLLISSSVDITEHKEVERWLAERAHIDKLTGLPDRVRIAEYADAIIQSANARPFAIAFIDLDNFKHVNDYYSHATGDALLIKISERIKSKL